MIEQLDKIINLAQDLRMQLGAKDFELSTRARNVLIEQGITRPEQLSKYKREQVLGFRKSGFKTVDEMERWLQFNGLEFAK